MGSHPISARSSELLATKSREDLARWFGISDKKLRHLLYALRPEDRYKEFSIRKKHGGSRLIEAPSVGLRRLQRVLHESFSEICPPSGAAKGFVRGRSVVDHAQLHTNRRWVVTADIEDFFPSINFGRVLGALRARPFLLPDPVAVVVAQICCHKGRLPQGAPTSPVLANLICRSLDRDLLKLAKENKLTYSRYADDLCFSTNLGALPTALAKEESDGRGFSPGLDLARLVSANGFALNLKKFRVSGARERQMVTGLTVNSRAAMPRRWRRQLRTMLHLLEKRGDAGAFSIVKAWDGWPFRNSRPIDLTSIVVGRAGFASWIDKVSPSFFVDSLRRGYPSLRKLLPLPRRPGISFRLMTEGDSDELHLSAALKYFQSEGRHIAIDPKFKNFHGDKGDTDLLATIRRIARADIDELTVALFDCDNHKLLGQVGLSAGSYEPLGRRTYVACLARPSFVGPTYCVESLYSRADATKWSSSGRRLFFGDEFDPVTGISLDGAFQRDFPKKSELIVSTKVTRLNDGESVLLSKAEFAALVVRREAPFDDMDFSGFDGTFVMLLSLVEDVLGSVR